MTKPNPWLTVPLEDYEGHMRSPEVAQLDALADLFAETLTRVRPRTVAVLGVAGGNGLERIDRLVTERVVGIDVSLAFLEAVWQRYPNEIELHCVDLAAERITLEPVELVHAALLFEHAGVELCLENAVSMVVPKGVLSVVLQMPGEGTTAIGPSRFRSVQALRAEFRLVDPNYLIGVLMTKGFELSEQRRHPLPAGRSFWMGLFTYEPYKLKVTRNGTG